MAQGAGKLKAAKTSGGRKNNGLTKKGKRNCAPKKAMASKEYMTKKVSVQFAELAELVWDRASGWNQTIELQDASERPETASSYIHARRGNARHSACFEERCQAP